MITEEEINREGERIIAEFGEYAREFTLKDSFYHGKFGRYAFFNVCLFEKKVQMSTVLRKNSRRAGIQTSFPPKWRFMSDKFNAF